MSSEGEEEELDAPLMPPQTSHTEDKPSEQEAGKDSVSNVMEKVIDIQVPSSQESKATAEDHEVASEVSSSVRKIDYFQTDTSDLIVPGLSRLENNPSCHPQIL